MRAKTQACGGKTQDESSWGWTHHWRIIHWDYDQSDVCNVLSMLWAFDAVRIVVVHTQGQVELCHALVPETVQTPVSNRALVKRRNDHQGAPVDVLSGTDDALWWHTLHFEQWGTIVLVPRDELVRH